MKKIFAVAVATVMTVAMSVSAFAAETLTGTAWWTGMQVGQDYALKDGKVTLVVETSEDAGAFSVEVYNPGTDAADDGYFMTSGSDGNAWFAELLVADGSTMSSPFADNNNADPGKFVAGNTYEVTVTVSGADYKMEYYDATKGEMMYTMTGKTAYAGEVPELKVHIMAQVGTYTVSEKVADTPADDTPADSTPTTGDMTAVLPVAVLAVAAMAVVVVMKKKAVTE